MSARDAKRGDGAPETPGGAGGGDGGEEPGAPGLREDLRAVAPSLPERLEASGDDIEEGVARLVLTLVEFIRQILEHQAVRRMEGGSLADEEVEELGMALLRLQERLEEIKLAFGVEDEELNIDLGPLGRLL